MIKLYLVSKGGCQIYGYYIKIIFHVFHKSDTNVYMLPMT